MRVLVVDDSAFMRKAIVSMLESDPEIEVVGTAKNGKEGYELAKKLRPTVITLDIEMPEMDGLTALKKIMRDCPTHVIMVSSLTTEGSEASFTALKLGAADVIAKDHSTVSFTITKIQDELVSRVKALSKSKYRPRGHGVMPAQAVAEKVGARSKQVKFAPDQFSLICIGSSTGGPPVLEKIVTSLHGGFDIPIVVAQHMPEVFTQSFADRLSRMSSHEVLHAESGMRIERKKIYIARGGLNTHIVRPRTGAMKIRIDDLPEGTLYKPSVNELLKSAAECVGKRCLGIVLTGIGDDGLKGATALSSVGGVVLSQDAETSVVYGMPRAVSEAGISQASVNPQEISDLLNSLVGRSVRLAG